MAKPRPGKYDHVIGDLQPAPPADLPFQARVDEVKLTLDPLDTVDVATEYIMLRKGSCRVVDKMFEALRKDLQMTPEEETKLIVDCLGKDGIERLEKACNLRLEAATQLLAKRQDEGIGPWGAYGVKDNALRLEDGSTIRVSSEPYGQVKDKEAFRLWCIANGYERQLQLWPTSMNAIVKERCANGDPYPDGTEAFRKDVVKFIKAGSTE